MKSIDLNTTSLNSSEQALINKATREYEQEEYKLACNDYLKAFSNGARIQNLQFMIGNCLLKMDDTRQARFHIIHELFDYPDNKAAQDLLNDLAVKINGRMIRQEFHQTEKPEKVPSISLVLIVKNEEENLPRCLESFKDIVQEIVVVDTGSVDKTVEIAKSFGARVEYYEWNNDFAAARNESLKYASCDWILRTDADEYIEDEEKPKLLHAVVSGLADIYICPTLSGAADKDVIVGENVRLIRNHLGVKYESPIHENVDLSAIKLGITQCSTNIKFLHSGYDDLNDEEWKRKLTRNAAICDQEIKKNPKNGFIRSVKGLSLINLKKEEEGIEELEAAVANLDKETRATRYLGLAYFILTNYYLKKKKDIDLGKLLREMMIDFFQFSSLMIFVAEQYLYKFLNFEKAEKILRFVYKSYNPSGTFEDIIPENNYNKETLLVDLIEISLFENNEKKVQQYLKHWETQKNSADQEKRKAFEVTDWRQYAKTKLEEKKWKEAYRAIILSAAKEKLRIKDLFDLAMCKTQLNETYFTHFLVAEAEKIDPNSAVAANIDSLAYVKEKDYDRAVEKAVMAFIRDPRNAGFKDNLEQIASMANMTPVVALKKTGLQWMNSGQIKDGLFALIMYQKFQPDDSETAAIIQKYT